MLHMIYRELWEVTLAVIHIEKQTAYTAVGIVSASQSVNSAMQEIEPERQSAGIKRYIIYVN